MNTFFIWNYVVALFYHYKNFGICQRRETWTDLKENVGRDSAKVIFAWAYFVAETPSSFHLPILFTLRRQNYPRQLNSSTEKTFFPTKRMSIEWFFTHYHHHVYKKIYIISIHVCFVGRNCFHQQKYFCNDPNS